MESIGKRIKTIRTRKSLSLSELAEAAGVAKSYLSNVERDIQTNPSIQFIEKIASTLKVPVNSLLFEQSDEEVLDPEWKQLVIEAMNSGIEKEQFIAYNNREALRSDAAGQLDGVKVKVNLLNVKKNFCSYTISMVSLQEKEKDNNSVQVFENFLKGFKIQ